MKKNLNGWLRLWILLTIIWMMVISYIAFDRRPLIENVSHEPAFEEQMSSESKAILAECKQEKDQFTSCVIWDDEVGVKAEMPNGHSLWFKKGLSDEQMNKAGDDYWRIVEDTYAKQLTEHFVIFSSYWLISSLMVLVLGYGVNWVYRGFKN